VSDRNPFVVNIKVKPQTATHHLLANYFPKTYTGKELHERIAELYVKSTRPHKRIQQLIDNLYDLTITRTAYEGDYRLIGTCLWGYPDVNTISSLLRPMKKDCLEISLEYVEEHLQYVVSPK
jgi:hypothetical protein